MSEPIQLTITIALAAVLLALLHRWISAIERRIDERLQQLGDSQRAEDGAIRKLSADIEDLRDSLPSEYVRREDWIRFSAVLEAKIDRIAERQWEVAQALRSRDGHRS